MQRMSLSAKLTITIGTLTTLMTLISAGAITYLVYHETENQIASTMTRDTHTIVTEHLTITDGSLMLSHDDGGSLLSQFLRESNLSLVITDTSLRPIARYGIYRNLTSSDMEQFLPSPLLTLFTPEKSGYYVDVESAIHGRYDTYTIPLRTGMITVGYVQTAQSNDILPLLFASLKNTLLILLPLVWVVTLIIGIGVTCMAMHPLTTFVSYVEKLDITRMHKPIVIPASLPREVSTLTESFNSLMRRITTLVERERNTVKNISHELKTPLARVSTALSSLLPQASPATRPVIHQSIDDIIHMGRTIETILSLSQDSDVHTYPAWKVRPLIMTLLSHNETPSAARVHIPPSLTLTVSPHHMAVVLRNLIENALKYSPRPHAVDVTATTTSDVWKIVVSNPIRRSELQTVSGYRLGLALTRLLTTQQHWEMTTESNPTQFTVTLSGHI